MLAVRWEADFPVYLLDHSPAPSELPRFLLLLVIDERKRREEIFLCHSALKLFFQSIFNPQKRRRGEISADRLYLRQILFFN